MKKLVSLIIAAVMLLSLGAVSADTYENKVYTFTNVNSTATFDKDGEAVSIDSTDVIRFSDSKVTMNIAGDATSVIFCKIALTKYDSSEITFDAVGSYLAEAVIFTDGDFEPVEIEQGAYLLILSKFTEEEEKGSSVIVLVGEQTVVPETTPSAPQAGKAFGENAVISDWAITEATEAYDNSLVTVELYRNGNYKRNITRREFAHVMAQVLSQCGADYDAYVEKLGDNPTLKFADTNGDLEIEFVSSYGVINGMSETEFGPDLELTREQAAAMLARTITALGKTPTIETNIAAFVDEAEFSDWSKASIYTVAGLRDKVNNFAVMGGMGEGVFSPKTGYTVEQALIAVKRFLRAVK